MGLSLRAFVPAGLALFSVLGVGCGSGSGPATPTIGAAKTFELIDLKPAGPVEPGKVSVVSFKIRLPSGETLRTYQTGPGPHTRVHLLIVREDLATLIHRHPQIASDGAVRQPIVFPSPGVYRIVVDAYPRIPSRPELRNFQLFTKVRARGDYKPEKVPPFRATQVIDGYRVRMLGRPKVQAIVPSFLKFSVKDPAGRPAEFSTYFGALAHAIFFHQGSLDYFHTHVCGPTTPGCGSVTGAPTGSSTARGVLQAGVLLPEGGIWRLFLQSRVKGKVVTAPFTLRVKPPGP